MGYSGTKVRCSDHFWEAWNDKSFGSSDFVLLGDLIFSLFWWYVCQTALLGILSFMFEMLQPKKLQDHCGREKFPCTQRNSRNMEVCPLHDETWTSRKSDEIYQKYLCCFQVVSNRQIARHLRVWVFHGFMYIVGVLLKAEECLLWRSGVREPFRGTAVRYYWAGVFAIIHPGHEHQIPHHANAFTFLQQL